MVFDSAKKLSEFINISWLFIFQTSALAAQKTVAGPEKPIGHSLQNAAAQTRVYQLLAQANSTAIQTDAATPAKHQLPPLVGGQYGFTAPKPLQGTPSAFVSLGSSTPTYGIVVEKLHHRLSLFRLTEDKRYEVVKTYRAITGKDPGDKVARGDNRTPEGIYFVTGRLSDAALPAKYGRLALTLDYPNVFDQRARKSGYGIWIHSTDDPARLQRAFDTEGCVVVSNEDVLDLAEYITPYETPVVVTKEMTTVQPQDLEEPRKKALAMIDSWRMAWESSGFENYMEFYSKNFISLGKNKDSWEKFKQNLSSRRDGKINVRISEPKIVAFENQLLAVFMQDYRTEEHSDFGRKFLYLKWEGDRYRIIAEKWYKSRKPETAFRDFKSL
jgi:murein L,D-transpeptidase YafK